MMEVLIEETGRRWALRAWLKALLPSDGCAAYIQDTLDSGYAHEVFVVSASLVSPHSSFSQS